MVIKIIGIAMVAIMLIGVGYVAGKKSNLTIIPVVISQPTRTVEITKVEPTETKAPASTTVPTAKPI